MKILILVDPNGDFVTEEVKSPDGFVAARKRLNFAADAATLDHPTRLYCVDVELPAKEATPAAAMVVG